MTSHVRFIQRRLRIGLALMAAASSFATTATAQQLTYWQLLQQAERPTIEQVRSALGEDWQPTTLPTGSGLPDPEKKPDESLVYNFQAWYEQLLKGGPKMIATFERSFPGATWVFIGRDMALLADLFESFYLGLGQSDRVVRLGMSSGTLEANGVRILDDAGAMRLLESHNVRPLQRETPTIFIDAISRGGGRQSRALMGAIFNTAKAQGLNPAEQLYFSNVIGLRVFTTKIPDLPVTHALEHLRTQEAVYRANPQIHFENQHAILTYDDGRPSGSFVGVNEAGYTHWTGFWGDSFGPVEIDAQGRFRARLGAPAAESMRVAILQLQAMVERAANSDSFRKSVIEEAQRLGYAFPTRRPRYIADPRVYLAERLAAATSATQALDALSNVSLSNFGRVPSAQLRSVAEAELRKKSFVISPTDLPSVDLYLGFQLSADFTLDLLRRTQGHSERMMIYEWAASRLPTRASGAWPAFVASASRLLNESAPRGEEGRRLTESFIANPIVDVGTKVDLVKALYASAATPDERFAVLGRAIDVLPVSNVVGLLKSGWYDRISNDAFAAGFVSDLIERLRPIAPHLELDLRRRYLSLALRSAPNADRFIEIMERAESKDLHAALLAEPGIADGFFSRQPTAEQVNRLASTFGELSESVFIAALTRITDETTVNSLKLPGLLSRSRELRAALSEWRDRHQKGGLVRSCVRALTKR